MQHVVEAIVGSVVVTISVLLLSYAYSFQTKQSDGYTLRAQVSHVAGLSAGADVCVGGVKVGVVDTISLDPDTYNANVVLRMNKDVQLPIDSTLSVDSASLLGGKYVSISPGTEDDMLADGGKIIIATGSMSLEKMLIQSFTKNAK